MRGFAVAVVLSLMLTTAPTFAQTTPPAQTAPAAQQPAPKPTTPGQPAPAAPAPAPAAPFPQGAKVAYINIQRIANDSGEGKAATAKVQALNQKKVAELNEKNKALQADQQKLQSGGTVLSDAARAELEKKIERQNVEIQRATQDAQAEVQELQQELQAEFQRKLFPIVQAVAQEKGVQVIFSAADSGIVWADPGIDLTADVIKRFDSGATATPAPKPPAAAPKPPLQ
jgi:outer membrane protein